jgi:hypothetical protein
MSLTTLVEFAQEHFGAFYRRRQPDEGLAPSLDVKGPPRQLRPTWIGDASDRDISFGADHPWRIEGRIEPQSSEIEEFNPDALAFWMPFHFYRERWGIFTRTSGIIQLACVLKGSALLPGDERYLDMAEVLLLEHELGHAIIEIACARAELIARVPIYEPYFADNEASPHEEALCNAQAIMWGPVSDDAQASSRAQTWMERQGPGYRAFKLWATSRKLSAGMDRAARYMLKPLPPPCPKRSRPSLTFLFRGARRYKIPIIRIADQQSSNASVLRPFPKQFGIQVMVHTNDHPPPHIHIRTLSDCLETRYTWPQLSPLKGDRILPARNKGSLDDYVKAHGEEIEDKVRRVYGS